MVRSCLHVCITYSHPQTPHQQEKHFRELSAKLGVDFEKMLFFDDERRNIHEVGGLRWLLEWSIG